MKPERNSLRLLSITQAKAKMYEYDVPLENHIVIPQDPARLFTLTIGLLGDLAAQVNSKESNPHSIEELEKVLFFSSKFFDSYFNTRLDSDNDPYLLLLGSASYYLSQLPGSSLLLARTLHAKGDLDIGGMGLEKLLLWILRGEFTTAINITEGEYAEDINRLFDLYQGFYSSGENATELFDTADHLRTLAYAEGTPRQLLLADIIGAITRKRYDNSTWVSLPAYTGLPLDTWRATFMNPDFKLKELWPAQKLLGERGVFSGRSAVIQMPTSAGKTRGAEIVIRSAFLSGRASLAVVVAPFRALCHEIRDSLSNSLRSEGIRVNELSDVLQIDFDLHAFLDQRQVLVVTPEKLNYVLRHSPELGERIQLIIYDEGHQFDNGTRGITYELLLTSLKEKLPENVQSVLISAVISNGEAVGRWLNGENSESIVGTNLLPTYRSLAFVSWLLPLGQLAYVNPDNPNEREFFVPRIIREVTLQKRKKERLERIFPERGSVSDIALYLGLTVVNKGSVAIFCGTKITIASILNRLIDIYSRGLSYPLPIEISDFVEVEKLFHLISFNMGSDSPIAVCCRMGIFTHHNSVSQGIRQSVEYAMKIGSIKFVICTSTLAQGVNLPIRYLIINNTYQGKEKIKVRDFQNLLGRSGRSDMHTEGSIIFADPRIFDDTLVQKDSRRWDETIHLLDPSNSEECNSTLKSLFDSIDVQIEYQGDLISVSLSFDEISRFYPQGYEAVLHYASQKVPDFDRRQELVSTLFDRVYWKFEILAGIESFLLAHFEDANIEIDDVHMVELARGTFAYFLADQNQRTEIESLFLMLAHNIEQKIPEPRLKVLFGRTLLGVHDALIIQSWLFDKTNNLLSADGDLELLNTLWPILLNNIKTGSFQKCSQRESLLLIATEWINGDPFVELLNTLHSNNIQMAWGRFFRNYDIDHVVDICENGLSYEGGLIVSAIIDFLSDNQDDLGIAVLINNLQNLLKRLKYGLESPQAIVLYEMGFSDRVVSGQLAGILEDLPADKETIRLALRSRREQVFRVLDTFPQYFSEVYRGII